MRTAKVYPVFCKQVNFTFIHQHSFAIKCRVVAARGYGWLRLIVVSKINAADFSSRYSYYRVALVSGYGSQRKFINRQIRSGTVGIIAHIAYVKIKAVKGNIFPVYISGALQVNRLMYGIAQRIYAINSSSTAAIIKTPQAIVRPLQAAAFYQDITDRIYFYKWCIAGAGVSAATIVYRGRRIKVIGHSISTTRHLAIGSIITEQQQRKTGYQSVL